MPKRERVRIDADHYYQRAGKYWEEVILSCDGKLYPTSCCSAELRLLRALLRARAEIRKLKGARRAKA